MDAITAEIERLAKMDKMTEEQLLRQAVDLLQARLPQGWSAGLTTHSLDGGQTDTLLAIEGPQSSRAAVLVEARRSITPKEIQVLLGASLLKRLRAHGQRPIMVVAPYLSPRSRELLISEDVGYLDLTGNLRLSLAYPGLYLETQGADKNPSPEKRRTRGLRGAQVGSIVRALVDVEPPYGVTELAKKALVDPGYATRVFETLESEALIERAGRGRIVEVKWDDLLRQRASALDLLAPHRTRLFISQLGATETLAELGRLGEEAYVVTGSFAASRLAPVAAPALLVVYTLLDAQDLGGRLRLLPTSEGADVAIVRPENYGPFFNLGFDKDGAANMAAPSQVAIDCLSGNGRMPAEGEALIEWMQQNEKRWRASSLEGVSWPPWVRK
ncbi:MAG TPA: hypothetical protein VEV82_01870 [Actinomycetota bacterium]|nr:hypothetical protein [Actinomycetota bacterium]